MCTVHTIWLGFFLKSPIMDSPRNAPWQVHEYAQINGSHHCRRVQFRSQVHLCIFLQFIKDGR